MDQSKILSQSWLVFPPLVAEYYRQSHADYNELPPFHPLCNTTNNNNNSPIQLIYPYADASIYLPIDIDGSKQKTIAKAAHQKESSTLYWHLDGTYIGSTETFHTIAIDPEMGDHQLVIVDQWGNTAKQSFEVLSE